LLDQFVYPGEQAGVEVAERYFAAVEETYALLLTQPQSGASYESEIERLGGLRRVPVNAALMSSVSYTPHVTSRAFSEARRANAFLSLRLSTG
jgi:plasmid stabilization system protein ParE